MTKFDQNFWTERYKNKSTGWDLGKASAPLIHFIDSIGSLDLKILIPGAGNAYEAEYLWSKGFKNIYVIDIAEPPLDNLRNRLPELPKTQIIHQNFFDHEASYDLILEQTFFCALDPNLRFSYRDHTSALLSRKGTVAGVLFDFPLNSSGPPFGGSLAEYRKLFQSSFTIKTLEPCYNSEPSRDGKELFFIFEKK
jgi:thiopurine S-methyltransferase